MSTSVAVTENHDSCARLSKLLPLMMSSSATKEEQILMSDLTTEEEYSSMSNLLEEFTSISNIDKTWIFKSKSGLDSQAMFLISQPSLLTNKRKKFILSTHISKESNTYVNFQWAPFPIEMRGVCKIVPSPSGSKLLVVRETDSRSPTQFEIWSPSHMEKEFHIPQSVHGSMYTDGWDLGGWKGQGDFEDDWGESYTGKRQPALFVINTNSGEVRAVKGIEKSLSVGQVVWDPSDRNLVFVGWLSDRRKLGIKVCYNRPSALYVARAPNFESEANTHDHEKFSTEDMSAINLTHQSISSAVFPRFSPDGKFLVFFSGRSSVESGAHSCTKSLHRIEWPMDENKFKSVKIVDAVSSSVLIFFHALSMFTGRLKLYSLFYSIWSMKIPVVMSPEDGSFPGLYTPCVLHNPWLSDGHTMIIPSVWGSRQVILSVNVMSAQVSRISPADSDFSWNVLALDGDYVVAVSSTPVDVPQIKYGYLVNKATKNDTWRWLNVTSPIFRCTEKVRSSLSNLQFTIINIPVKDVCDSLTKGIICHFDVADDSMTFWQGSLGFGEESLRSLTGNFGSQDVNDVLIGIDHVIDMGLTSPFKNTLFGGSHGGFLTTHLIGQAPDSFVAAAVKNPVCNLALMACTSDIPDWCYVGAYGSEAKNIFTEAPSHSVLQQVSYFTYLKAKWEFDDLSLQVKTPTFFLLGADDRRVPYYNGLQYARALRERGVDCKIIVFPNHRHAIRRPQSDFECYINIALRFKKYCKENLLCS
ncbi:hypothetical protein FEM48_Zijuj07G0115100 [Ziziphus jujuba var. spinosa]|uniref:acylaminoacyl-peptidase n=1 Tax=Ziziphus jujuba var. spinosa TaxID=714518 RepID=A0A978V4D5_ZIZJJ|nr:hypothetical protein FEM48_Zijuj07G0115100 [Ziziphus jujuba var. spinosa]